MERNFVVYIPEEGSARRRTTQNVQERPGIPSPSRSEFLRIQGTADAHTYESPDERVILQRAKQGIYRVHFTLKDPDTTDHSTRFIGGLSCKPPIVVRASRRYTEFLMSGIKEIKEGVYNVRIALNLDHLVIDRIESISLTQCHGDRSGALEIFTKQDLKEWQGASKSKILLLALHRQYCVEGKFDHRSFVMEIRAPFSTSPQDDPGYIELLYIETHATQCNTSVDRNNGTVFKLHRPFLWSVDVGIKEIDDDDDDDDDQAQTQAQTVPGRIIYYAASGDGNYIATLSTRDNILQLDMWDLEPDLRLSADDPQMTLPLTNLDAYNVRKPFTPKLPCAQRQTTILQPVESDIFYDYRDMGPSIEPCPLRISVSFDASKVVLMDGEQMFLAETFQAFTFKDAAPSIRAEEPSRKKKLTRIGNKEIDQRLTNFCGYGKFHFTSPDKTDPRLELFITCDRRNVDIYTVYEGWEWIRTISISTEDSILTNPRRIIEGLGAKYFSWLDKNNISYVCDMETGNLVHTMDPGATVYFSKDGSLMLCNERDTTTTRWTKSGTLLDTTCVEDSTLSQVFPAFIENGNHIIVPVVKPLEKFGRARQGLILDTTTLTTLERVSYSTRFHEQQPQSGPLGRYLYSSHGSKLDLIRLQDITVTSYNQQKYRCNDRCKLRLTDLQESDIIGEESDRRATVSIPNSDLTVTVKFEEEDISGYDAYAVVVTISDSQGGEREVLRIPPLCIGTTCAKYKLHVDEANLQLIVDCQLIVMVWDLPATFRENVTLQSALWVQQFTYKEKYSERELEDTVWSPIALRVCHYGRLHASLKSNNNTLHLGRADPISTYPFEFFNALFMLIHMFDAARDPFQQAVLRYVGRYINRTVEHDETILTKICESVRQENHALIDPFLKAMFDSPHVRWVPKPGLSREMNPISLLLRTSRSLPRAINLAQTVINYCIRKAREENDWDFASPVLDSLHELLKLQELPPDLVLSTFRGLAFIQTQQRSHIINHAIVPRPFRLRRLLGNHNAKPIYAYKNPIIQLDPSPMFKEHDPLNDNFTRNLFVASFDMLWRAPNKLPDPRSPVERIKNRQVRPAPSWIHTLFYAFLAKCRLWHNPPRSRIQFYDLPLEALDNPAIAALIEYKWNTIGHVYWVARFFSQCIFYLLVIVAVLMQVYDNGAGYWLKGVFIAITALTSMFLFLELQQFLQNPRRYITSPYNLMDLVAFALPLAGSVCQIFNITENDDGNIATLSFSIVFIFLHILFELRVHKGICHFVAIIIRIIGEIRVFFIIFAAGILAFTISIIHLLYACPVEVCPRIQEKPSSFPRKFHRALTTTYFFMGGVWDSVSDDLDNGYWTFHVMMMLYFFFTTIVLLNVLIALMNDAFRDGDEQWLLVWRESRLRCIEIAESVTYSIPGFREAYNYFPERIYYFGTHKEQKEYYTKYSYEDSEDLIGGYNIHSGQRRPVSALSPSGGGNGGGRTTSSYPTTAGTRRSQDDYLKMLQHIQEEQHHKTGMEELKRELKHDREQSQSQLNGLQERLREQRQELQSQFKDQQRVLQDQLREQQHSFEKQMDAMKEMLAAALAAKS